MDASCKIQGSIHVFRLVNNMCPGKWVHIIADDGAFIMYFYLHFVYTINIKYKNYYMRGIYEYTYMSHHYCRYRYITDETLSTAANFDRHGYPDDVYRL